MYGDAVTGIFAGQPEGSTVGLWYSGTNYSFAISYQGGDGNDVVLGGGTIDEVLAPMSESEKP